MSDMSWETIVWVIALVVILGIGFYPGEFPWEREEEREEGREGVAEPMSHVKLRDPPYDWEQE